MLLNFVKLGELQLFGKTISWVEIFRMRIILDGNFPGGNCPSGSYPRLEYSGWEFSKWELSWMGIFFGGSFPGENCRVGIIWVAIFQVGVFMLPKINPRGCKNSNMYIRKCKTRKCEIIAKCALGYITIRNLFSLVLK